MKLHWSNKKVCLAGPILLWRADGVLTLPGAAFEGFFLCWMQQNARCLCRGSPPGHKFCTRPASPDKAEEWIMKQKAKRAAFFFPASVGFWLLSAVGFLASVGVFDSVGYSTHRRMTRKYILEMVAFGLHWLQVILLLLLLVAVVAAVVLLLGVASKQDRRHEQRGYIAEACARQQYKCRVARSVKILGQFCSKGGWMLISALSQSYVILPECIHRVEHMIILDDSFPSQKNEATERLERCG